MDRTAPPPMPRVVVIDGLIGAGKSTLLALLAEALRARGLSVVVAPEPVDKWRECGALGLFYSDPARWAVEFQTYVYVTRVNSICDAMRERPSPDVVLLERSVLTDRGVFFRMADTNAVQQRMYDSWCDTWQRMLPFDLRAADFVFLRPSMAACMSRVHGRARVEEVHPGAAGAAGEATAKPAGVSEEYQARLLATYEQFFDGLARDGRRVHVLEDDADYREDPTRTRFCDQLIARLGL